LLADLGLTPSCLEIDRTADRHQKNLIFMEEIESAIAVAVVSAEAGALGLFLISNPLDWGVAIARGTAGGFRAMGVGTGLHYLYDIYGNRVALVNATKVDRLCR
jgi:hypothetical protein